MTVRTYRSLAAEACLLFVTFLWALSYILVKISLGEGVLEMNMTALRFLIASLVVAACFGRRLFPLQKLALIHGIGVGVLLYVIYIGSTYALRFTAATNSAFLISLSVIFVPILGFFFFRDRPEKRTILGIVLAVSGMALMLYTPTLTFNLGDILSLLTAVLCGGQIIYIGRVVNRVNPWQLGMVQIFTVAILSAVTALFVEGVTMPHSLPGWGAVLGLALLCTAFPFVVQPLAQRFTSSTRAGLIFSMESLFAAFLAFFFLGEILSWRGYLGAALMLVGIITAELDLKEIFFRGRRQGKSIPTE